MFKEWNALGRVTVPNVAQASKPVKLPVPTPEPGPAPSFVRPRAPMTASMAGEKTVQMPALGADNPAVLAQNRARMQAAKTQPLDQPPPDFKSSPATAELEDNLMRHFGMTPPSRATATTAQMPAQGIQARPGLGVLGAAAGGLGIGAAGATAIERASRPEKPVDVSDLLADRNVAETAGEPRSTPETTGEPPADALVPENPSTEPAATPPPADYMKYLPHGLAAAGLLGGGALLLNRWTQPSAEEKERKRRMAAGLPA